MYSGTWPLATGDHVRDGLTAEKACRRKWNGGREVGTKAVAGLRPQYIQRTQYARQRRHTCALADVAKLCLTPEPGGLCASRVAFRSYRPALVCWGLGAASVTDIAPVGCQIPCAAPRPRLRHLMSLDASCRAGVQASLGHRDCTHRLPDPLCSTMALVKTRSNLNASYREGVSTALASVTALVGCQNPCAAPWLGQDAV